MGFELEATHYQLAFTDPRLKGLEVTMERMSLGEALDFDATRFSKATSTEEVAEKTRKTAQQVAGKIVAWNVEKNGEPVNPDLAGILAQDELILHSIVSAWVDAIRGVPVPLPAGSNSGSPFPEESIPMESL